MAAMRRCVFLDRDGVLNHRKWNLVRRPEQVRILPGAAQAAAHLHQAGFAVVIVTNQEWVGSGYITPDDHAAIMARVKGAIVDAGGAVDGAYACVHARGVDCDDRKPKPGMLIDAARELDLDLARSFMVGDNRKDLVAGHAAGCRSVLVDPRMRTFLQGARAHADHVARDLEEAARWIVGR